MMPKLRTLFLLFLIPTCFWGKDFTPLLSFDPASLIYPKKTRYRQVASHDKTLGKLGDLIVIRPGKKVILADIQGAGIITNFWLTVDKGQGKSDPEFLLRKIILRMYWDNEKNPSVESPLGDFFGVGFSKYVPYTSLLVGMSSGGFYTYFPMPFHRHAVVEIENLSKVSFSLWYAIGYQEVKKLGKNILHFHARFHRTKRLKTGQNYLILEAKGRGHFAGVVLSMQGLRKKSLLFLEGDELITVDNEPSPSILGTGTEDFFMGGFYFNRGLFFAPLHGLTIKDVAMSRISAYRFRLQDVIPFTRSIKVEIEHGLTTGTDVPADYSSVAYWYQDEPHFAFTTFPDAAGLEPND